MSDPHGDRDRRTVWRQAIVRGVATAVICAVVWRLLDSERTLLSALLFGLIFGLIQIAWSIYTAPWVGRRQRERQARRERPPHVDEGNEGR